MDARQAAHGGSEMAVGARVILRPNGFASRQSSRGARPLVGGRRVHQAGESPLGLFLPVGGKRDVPMLYSTPDIRETGA